MNAIIDIGRWLASRPIRTAAIFCAIVCGVAYANVIFGGKTFLAVGNSASAYPEPPFSAHYTGKAATLKSMMDPAAHAWQAHPWAYEERRALLRDEMPFWNTHNGLGETLLSNGQTGTFHPLHWIALLDPTQPWLWDITYLLLRFLCGFFAVLLTLELGAPFWIAFVSGAFASINATFTVLVTREDQFAYAFMPMFLWSIARTLRVRTFGAWCLIVLSGWLTLTGGHPEPAFATLVTGGAIGLFMFVRLRDWPALGWYAAAGAALVLLSAPYWLPVLLHTRTAWSQHPEGFGTYGLPLRTIGQWIAPSIFAPRFDLLAGFWSDDAGTWGFFGASVSLLALCGWLSAIIMRRRDLWPWAVVSSLMVGKIFNVPGTMWIGHLPLFSQMTIQQHCQFAAGFGVVAGGLLGVPSLTALKPSQRLWLIGSSAAFLFLVLVVCFHVGGPRDASFKHVAMFFSRYALILAATGVALGWSSSTSVRPRLRWAGQAATVVIVISELAGYRGQASDRGNPTAVPPYALWLQSQQKDAPPFRTMGMDIYMAPNMATAWELDDVRVADALFPKTYMALLHTYFDPTMDGLWFWANPAHGFTLPNRFLNFLNVRYVVADMTSLATLGNYRVAYTDHDMRNGAVIENPDVWPRIFGSGSPTFARSEDEALHALATMDMSQPRVMLTGADAETAWSHVRTRGETARAFISAERMVGNTASFHVASASPNAVVIGTVNVEGWTATIDGVPTPIYPANYLLQGVLVPGGEHEVRLEFRPPGWRAAILACGMGVIFVLFCWWIRRQPRAVPSLTA